MKTYQLNEVKLISYYVHKMKIYQTIEEANQCVNELTDPMRYYINQEFSTDEWVKAARYFLLGIGNQHRLPGKLIFQINDICGYHFRQEGITTSQCFFLSNNLIEHWDQISYEYRSYATMC